MLQVPGPVFEEVLQACVSMHQQAHSATADFNQRTGGKPMFYVTGCHYLQFLQTVKWVAEGGAAGARHAAGIIDSL